MEFCGKQPVSFKIVMNCQPIERVPFLTSLGYELTHWTEDIDCKVTCFNYMCETGQPRKGKQDTTKIIYSNGGTNSHMQ